MLNFSRKLFRFLCPVFAYISIIAGTVAGLIWGMSTEGPMALIGWLIGLLFGCIGAGSFASFVYIDKRLEEIDTGLNNMNNKCDK